MMKQLAKQTMIFSTFTGFLLIGTMSAETNEKEGGLVAKIPSALELLDTRCLICHGSPQKGNARLAPPMEMVKSHYEDLDEKEFVAAIASWVKEPQAKKTRMPGAVKRFGMMPPLPYPDEELKTIATYLFQTKFEGESCTEVGKGNEKQKEKGKGKGKQKGKGRGKGKGQGKGGCCEEGCACVTE